MKKILWCDVETTGTDEKKHGLIQISALIDIDGHIIDEFDEYVRPFKNDFITKTALEKNNTTLDELRYNIEKYQEACEVHNKFIDWMGKHVNRFDKKDKFIIAGKKTEFDIRFLRAWWDKCGDNYYGAWFHYPHLDLEQRLAEVMLHEDELMLDRYRLEDICRFIGVELNDAHNSKFDILATYKCWYKLEGRDV